MTATLTFLGHATFLISSGSRRVLIDPFLSGNPQAPDKDGLRADDIEVTDIVVTHAHADHFADTPAIAKRTGATVFAAFEICEYLQQEHAIERVEPGNPGGQIDTDFGHVAFTQAFHSSSFEGRYMGMPCGAVVAIDGVGVHHLGDTALFSDLKLIGDHHRPHVAICPVGDRFTMGPEEGSRAMELVNPSVAVPCHFGTWPLLKSDISKFKPRGVEVRRLEPGESMPVV